MKTIIKLSFLFILIGLVSSCKPSGEKAKVSEAAPVAEESGKSFKVDQARISWEGKALTKSHKGTLSVSDGSISVEAGKVTGGNFTIDMTSMTNTDLPEDQRPKLVGHLASPDFFDVGKHPSAKFEITKVTGYTGTEGVNSLVYGNLTMKEVTKQVNFKANIDVSDNGVSVTTPSFTIDRTEWGVQYGSTKFFPDVKDKAINDNIGLIIKLRAL